MLTGHRCRDDSNIYETILSLLICHSHIVCDGLELLFKSIRKVLFIRLAIDRESAVYEKKGALPSSGVLRLLCTPAVVNV